MKAIYYRIICVVISLVMVIMPSSEFYDPINTSLFTPQYAKLVVIAFFILFIGLFFPFDNKKDL